MKLMIITQKVDFKDHNLGFFHAWIEKFSVKVEKVIVISQYVGKYDLPKNTEVYSLGKEKGYSKIRQLFNFYKYLFVNLKKVDVVFVHMIPIWVLFGWVAFKVLNKKVYLWYTHKSVTQSLKLAEKIVYKVFSASYESFRLPSKKIVVTGHGIDTNFFSPDKTPNPSEILNILSVSRISESKNIDIMILAIEKLLEDGKKVHLDILGGTMTNADNNYFNKLKKLVTDKGLEESISFKGPMLQKDILKYYNKSNLFLNFSNTGSLDKAVLEAMSMTVDVLTSNEAFFDMLLEENIIKSLNIDTVYLKIKYLINHGGENRKTRDIIIKNHNLDNLISKLIKLMK